MRPRVKRWNAHQWQKTKTPISNCFKKTDHFKNALFFSTAIMNTVFTKWSQYRWLWLWSHSLQKYLISEDCDYDRSPHKMIAILFLRVEIMIAVFIKCTIYEDWDHDHSPHKIIIFLSLYMIATIRTAIMIEVFTKMSYIEFLWDHNPHKMSYF